MLAFATPQLCQTRVCGPVVDVVAEVKNSTDGVTFIHQEIYANNDINQIFGGLGLLDRAGDVLRDGAHLRVGHLALRAEHAAQAADHRHQLGGRDGDVEVGPAVLHLLGQILPAHVVGAPASSASRALSPVANTTTVTSLPSPLGGRSCRAAAGRRGGR